MSLYEYKHPIINKELATGPDAASRKQFPTLEAWYDVVNDYEFQARCPIILKNSHRNKHFTFACHLKSCPFKVLLSYSGHNKDGPFEQHGGPGGAEHEVGGEHGHGHPGASAGSPGAHNGGLKDEHDDVSAAIAAAVAAVTDGSNGNAAGGNGAGGNGLGGQVGAGQAPGMGARSGSGSGPASGSPSDHNGSGDDSLLDPDDPQQMSSVRGPFTVTKIDPYHNHPLESNLSLSKFVLTKVPRILQNDLKFDSILESLCNDEDNTVAKFRVSQYVEESGILDILKERYGLTDQDLDKKLLSHIARRITTYKARFVLKKKKNGTYGVPSSSMSAAAAAAAAINANGGAGAGSGPHDQTDELGGKKRGYGAGHHHHNGVNGDVPGDHEDELEGRKRTRTNKISTAVKMGTRSSLVNDPALAQLDDVNDSEDNKPPEDLAEQLRLLSSHLKEVEQQQQQQQQQQQHQEQQHHQHHQHHQHQDDHQLHQHHQQHSQMAGHHHSPGKEDIPDENIQPELRGQ
ncbi:DNA-binding protein ABF1 [Lachancea thermotolerans CBS 6340]|uniref:KLTH0D05148p n=1 Tax=Lachancea thermotolerans (strain ATCC 56472 / CBS 6340 / NRRL Y-8284) TaxID=559295 RepID=C5DGG5_LACTC|nr:KLTH0D05148p [Lachancea thermotolerans CBS 6340]CAR22507.1 KLTH0D05148p [Lachancea thermotolerans CBS 6340]